MADSTITWDLLARDRASQTVGRVGGSVDKLTQRVGRLAAAFGGVFALERAGEFALKMADQFELSRSRLEQITKNIGGDFESLEPQIVSLDKRLADFGFTNADVEGAVASLETATKNVPKALKDVALAADIARGRNISLEESTRILQRVETGHVSMLSRLGIPTIDKTTGKILTQKQALDLLSQTYAGTASHFADTFAGKQEALRAELANSAAEIGVALLPAAVDLAHVIQDQVLPPIQKAAEYFERNRKTIEPLIGVLLKLAIAYKAVKLARSAAETLRGVGGAKTALGTEVASLAKPVPVFVTNWKGGAFPGVLGTGSKAAGAGAAAAETSAGAAIGAAAAANLGRTATVLSKIITAIKFAPAAGVGAISDVHSSPDNGAFTRVLATVDRIRRQAGQKDVPVATFGAALAKAGFLKDPSSPAAAKILQQVALRFTAAAQAALKDAAAQRRVGSETGATTEKLQHQLKTLTKLQDRALAVAQGQDDLRSAIHNMAVVAGGESSSALRGNSNAALANRDALRGAVSSAMSYLKALKDRGASARHVADVEVALAKAVKRSASETYSNRSAVRALLKQLGFLPGQIEQVAGAYDDAAAAAQSFYGSQRRGLSDFNLVDADKAKKKQDDIIRHLTTGMTPVVSDAAQGAADAASAAFDRMKAKAKSDTQQIVGYFKQTKQELISSFASISTETMTDSLGGSYNRAQSVHSQLVEDAHKMHRFARLWHKLDALGLDPRLLAQFRGPDYIPAMQEILASGRKGIRRDNRLERQIAHDASSVAQTATSDRYGRLIHDDLNSLPRKLAREMRKELRHAHFEIDLKDHARHRGRRIRNKS